MHEIRRYKHFVCILFYKNNYQKWIYIIAGCFVMSILDNILIEANYVIILKVIRGILCD